MLPKVEIQTSKGCAWRAGYLIVNNCQVAHLGIDPHNGVTPTLFGAVGDRSFKLKLPTLRWRSDASPRYLRAYQTVQGLWHKVDGRYN